MKRKLYRSNKDKMLAGVCGGIAEELDIDSTIVRLIWAALGLAYGSGLMLYILAAIIIPERPLGSDKDFIDEDWQ